MDIKNSIYEKSPLWMQNFLISIQGWRNETKRVNKKEAIKFYEFLLQSQYWSKDQLLDYQNKMFLDLIKESFLYVPYYINLSKETDLSINDFKDIQDIKLLPILKKSMIRGNENNFVNNKYDVKKLLKGGTSGTTGTPLKLYFDNQTFSKRWAFELRLRNWAGLNNVYKPRRVQFTGRDIIPEYQKSQVFWRYNIPSNTLHCSTSNINANSVSLYLKAINEFKPEFIDGFPTAISVFVKLCMQKGYKLPSVKAVRVSAETLFDEDRKIIEEGFKTKVFNQFGSSESSCFCSDNEFGEMLVHPEFGLFEVIDDNSNDVEPTGTGKVITTSFINHIMPLIRYDLGDLVERGEKVTSFEGKNFERLDLVYGRIDDILEIPGKGYIARLTPIFKNIQDIIESQIILKNKFQLLIKLVVTESFDKSQIITLEKNTRKKVGNDIAIGFEFVDYIDRGPNGKFKTVIDLTKK